MGWAGSVTAGECVQGLGGWEDGKAKTNALLYHGQKPRMAAVRREDGSPTAVTHTQHGILILVFTTLTNSKTAKQQTASPRSAVRTQEWLEALFCLCCRSIPSQHCSATTLISVTQSQSCFTLIACKPHLQSPRLEAAAKALFFFDGGENVSPHLLIYHGVPMFRVNQSFSVGTPFPPSTLWDIPLKRYEESLGVCFGGGWGGYGGSKHYYQ